jgi:hypothetical protein
LVMLLLVVAVPGRASVVPVRAWSPARNTCPAAFPLGRKATRGREAGTTMLLDGRCC